MRFALITSGSHGDVHPFLGIGAELRRRGHEVVLFTHPYFTSHAQAASLDFQPINGHLDLEQFMRSHMHLPPARLGWAIYRAIIGGVPGLVDTLRRAFDAQRFDAVLSHVIAIGTRWVCEERGIPYALATLAPVFWLSPYDPAPAIQKHPGALRRRVCQAAIPLMRPLFAWMADRLLAGPRRKCGFPPQTGGAVLDAHGGAVNLGLWSPTVRSKLPGDPSAGRVTGYVWYDRGESDETRRRVTEFLEDGPPPVVFSLGTAHVHSPGAFYEMAAEACRLAGTRGLLLAGRGAASFANLPPGVCAVDYASFSTLLPRAAALVHHGGVGTTAQALRAGIPQLVVPQGNDQFNNAIRVHHLDAAHILRRSRMTAPRFAHALLRLLFDQSLRNNAVKLAAGIQIEDGAACAANELERIAGFVASRLPDRHVAIP